MLTFCSFLQSILVKVTKKVYHKSTVMIMGVVTVAVLTVAGGIFGGIEKNALTVHAETSPEMAQEGRPTEEIALFTEAKIHFQLTDSDTGKEIEGLVQNVQGQENVPGESSEVTEPARDDTEQDTEQREERIKAVTGQIARIAAEELSLQEAAATRTATAIQYTTQDYELLTRIVQAESGGCDIKGRILIANVIFNRIRSDEFPDTVTEVVYQKSQFSPVSDGSLKKCKVTPETVEAVDRALAGEDYSQGALYFMNRKLSSSRNVSWFDRNLTYLFQYDRHEFFK